MEDERMDVFDKPRFNASMVVVGLFGVGFFALCAWIAWLFGSWVCRIIELIK
uniref:Uncharacterized protein n=1 Tax=viral metagenome TaxID=1070528 RepID=A0A6H1ZDY3_9ZZZZ